MGVYLGQLPPAEIARFKAELAETIVANFCYPRFFDYRTESLQTRPIDRAKRQEVWLYLSSVDFTAWSRVDLTSTDFPRHIERLFIQFVQRNRSFFGAQGRRRMPDIRLSIATCAGSVAQRLRNHLTGQQNTPLFGSPRPSLSWTATPISGRPEPIWEQIMASTMELQQQLQQWRGETRTPAGAEEFGKTAQSSRSALTEAPTSISAANVQGRGVSRPQQVPANPMYPAASLDSANGVSQQATVPTLPVKGRSSQPPAQSGQSNRGTPVPNPAAASVAPVAPATPKVLKATVPSPSGSVPAVQRHSSGHLAQTVEQNKSARHSGGVIRSRRITAPTPAVSPARPPAPSVPSVDALPGSISSNSTAGPARSTEVQNVRPVPTSSLGFATSSTAANGQRETFAIGEDDVAIFEQMRRQLLLWLRIEALSAGLELSGQEGATQLLEMLRQQARYDETRLQIVSTLLNLAGQVIKTGTVSVLDYKQALTFHLMHTKRP